MISDNKVLAVITARAESKGVPGKNYRELFSYPLVIWSVKAAVQSRYIDYIFVSTNCPHVKKAVEEYQQEISDSRIKIVDRPDELATDTSKNEEALIHAVQTMEEVFGESPDIVINLQPTSPVRTDNILDRCIETMYETESDSLLTVSRKTPFFWRLVDDKWEPTYDPINRPMRQELAEDEFFFHDNGNIYICELNVLMTSMCRIGENPFLFETDEFQSMQIDIELDFLIFEIIAEEKGLL
jgi:CMP-N,N'-diacetyllegionaminic acid synthase